MTKLNWDSYLKWRESKGLNTGDVAIFIGSPVEVKSEQIVFNGDTVVQVQIGGKANLLVPVECVEE